MFTHTFTHKALCFFLIAKHAQCFQVVSCTQRLVLHPYSLKTILTLVLLWVSTFFCCIVIEWVGLLGQQPSNSKSALLCFQEFSIMLSTAASVLLLQLLLMYLYLVAEAKNTAAAFTLLVLVPSSDLLTISDYIYIYLYI